MSDGSLPPPLDASTIRMAEPVIEFVTEWTRQYFGCSRDEAFERLKRGADPGGMPITLLKCAFAEWAIPESRGLRSAMIEDMGEQTALRVLADMHRMLDEILAHASLQAGSINFETLDFPQRYRNKYLLSKETIVAQFEAYLQVITRAHLVDRALARRRS